MNGRLEVLRESFETFYNAALSLVKKMKHCFELLHTFSKNVVVSGLLQHQ